MVTAFMLPIWITGGDIFLMLTLRHFCGVSVTSRLKWDFIVFIGYMCTSIFPRWRAHWNL
ncbi:hypothetical protein BPAE_0059g00480 [Botrytis paeoniae]|uniref:Uncharacterized protein n=1 Tax=Botrytis paeoniae TaxID=278948 RepID=A0A4Z1FS69_9HELO|nr:hypothetical protein BPAE_0059g00480 [Botrytis paeoniae]